MLYALLLAVAPAHAQETLEVGVLRQEDIHVVQRLLYPKDDRSEVGVHVGVMPFDAYLTTPNLQLSYDHHLSEWAAISAVLGGGYGFKTGTYRQLESPAFGVAPYAYRYLGSALVGAEFAPIYAKMNLNGARVLHYDVYGVARGGLTVEQSVIPGGGLAFGPTVSAGIGSRLFTGPRTALRVEIRDDVVVEHRRITGTWHVKQNANLLVGITLLSRVEGR